MPYVDPQTVHNPSPGGIAPASWGDVIRDDLEFLIASPLCVVFNSAAVSVADNTLTKMLADSESVDTDSMHSTASNTSRITFNTPGRYRITACIVWDPNTTGERLVDFLVNNTTQYVGMAGAPNPSGASNTGYTVTRYITAAASDYVECRTRQKTGGALNTQLFEFSAKFDGR